MAVPQSNKKYIVMLIVLLGVLGALVGLYYVLTRPPQAVGVAKPKGYSHVYSIYGVGADRLYRPTEVAADSNGNIYIADTFKNRILVFDNNGQYVSSFGKRGTGPGELELPSGVTVDENGRIYVLQHTRNKVTVFNQSKKATWEIDVPRPLAATVKDKKLYITTDRGVMIGDLNGNLLNSFGRRGRAKGQFNRPTGIAVDDKGTIYVADSMNYRVSAYNKEGKHLWDVGAPPSSDKAIQSRDRKFGLPVSLTLSDDGLLYMMDAFNGEIYIFDTEGRQRGLVGEWGKEDGQFYYAAGITAMGSETFAVADKFNNRVQIVRIPSPNASPVARASRYLPWFLALLLLPLLLYLRRRKFVFIADEAFLQRSIGDGNVAALASSAGKIFVTEEVYNKYSNHVYGDVKMNKVLEVAEYADIDIDRLSKNYSLEDEAAQLLATQFKRAKVTLLTDNDRLQKAAAENKVVTLSYDEFVSGLQKQDKAS